MTECQHWLYATHITSLTSEDVFYLHTHNKHLYMLWGMACPLDPPALGAEASLSWQLQRPGYAIVL